MLIEDFVNIIAIRQKELYDGGRIHRPISCLQLVKCMYLTHREYLGTTGYGLVHEILDYEIVHKFKWIKSKTAWRMYSVFGSEDIRPFKKESFADYLMFSTRGQLVYKEDLVEILDKYLTMSYLDLSSLMSESSCLDLGVKYIRTENCLLGDWEYVNRQRKEEE